MLFMQLLPSVFNGLGKMFLFVIGLDENILNSEPQTEGHNDLVPLLCNAHCWPKSQSKRKTESQMDED